MVFHVDEIIIRQFEMQSQRHLCLYIRKSCLSDTKPRSFLLLQWVIHDNLSYTQIKCILHMCCHMMPCAVHSETISLNLFLGQKKTQKYIKYWNWPPIHVENFQLLAFGVSWLGVKCFHSHLTSDSLQAFWSYFSNQTQKPDWKLFGGI